MTNSIIAVINWFISSSGNLAKHLVLLLPRSPFHDFIEWSLSQDYLRYLNWLVPVAQMVAILEAWVLAIGIYYIYQIVLRWVKVVA
jgi:hypothetical protein